MQEGSRLRRGAAVAGLLGKPPGDLGAAIFERVAQDRRRLGSAACPAQPASRSASARRSMIARRWSTSSRLMARARPPAASGDRAPRAPRAGSGCRDRSRRARQRADRAQARASAAAANSGKSSSPAAIPPVASRPASSLASTDLRARDDRRRQAGELGDGDAVAAVGGAVGDFVEQDEVALPFARADVVQRQAVEPPGEPRQLMIMGREQGPAFDLVVHRLDHRPGDREPVVGRGAAPDLVEDDEAVRASPGRGSRRSRPSRP